MSDGPGEGWRLRVDDEAVLTSALADGAEAVRFRAGRWETADGSTLFEVRRSSDASGWSLLDAEGELAGSASSNEPLGERGGVYYFLLVDGRSFRLAPSGTRAGGFELTGWDLPGPYLIARPDPVGWSFETQPAGRGLEALRSLVFLVATRIVDAEGLQAE